MTFFLSWVVYPVVLVALSLGAGLGVRRLAGDRALPGVLVLPTGLAAIVTVSALTTQFDAVAELTAPCILLIAVAGFLAAGRSLLALRPSRGVLWPALAGLLPAAAIAAPVLLTGKPGLTGYTRLPDLMHQLQFTQWITHSGRTIPSASSIDSSYLETVVKMLGVGYPGGAQGALGGTSALIGVDPMWSYQAFLALLVGAIGLAIYALLGSAIASKPWRALAAGVAAQPTILYSYALAAGIKEVAAVAGITLVAALLFARRPDEGRMRELIPLAVATAAAFAVFNLGILPWLGMLFGAAFLADLVLRREDRVAVVTRWGVLGAGVALLSVPTIIVARRLAPVAASGGPPDLGNLAEAVPAWAAVGPWLTSDHRFPLALAGRETLTYVLIGLVLAFAVGGVLWSLRRRDPRMLALAATAVVALVFVGRRAGPWVDLKAYTITAPLVLTLAFVGAAALWRLPRRARWLGPVAVAAIAGSVLAGNALVYQDTTITHYDRFAELEQISERYAGQGPALHASLDDYPEYLLRDLQVTGMFNPPRPGVPFRDEAPGGTQFTRDLDDFGTRFVQSFPLLVLRRDPTISRPPSNYRLVTRMDFYDVWKRTSPAADVVEHIPLNGWRGERTAAMCDDLQTDLRRAGPGAQLAYAAAPVAVRTGPAEALSPGWQTDDLDHFPDGPGRLRQPVTLPHSGAYAVWLRGSVGREVRVLVDGKPLAKVHWQESFPYQYIPLATGTFAAGAHTVEIVRGGGSLLPSTGNDVGPDGATTRIGPLTFVPTNRVTAKVHRVDPTRALQLCRGETRLDWMEIVRR